MKTKNTLSAAALLFAGATLSNAAVYIDFGGNKTEPAANNIYVAEMSGTGTSAGSDSINQVFTDGQSTTITLNKATGMVVDAYYALESNSSQLVAELPVAATPFFDPALSGVWGDGIGMAYAAFDVEFVLEANTTYRIALFGGVVDMAYPSSNFTGLYLANGAGNKITGNAIYDGVTDNSSHFNINGIFNDVRQHLNGHTQIVYWEVETGAEAETMSLYAEGGVFNAISIEAVSTIPEPSTFGLLAGLGALALVVARRRRSRKIA